MRFIDEAHAADQPFFMWWTTTAMHFRTHSAGKHQGKSNGQGEYNDVMVAHDENVGRMLDKLDELGIADNTIVMYSTDNGPHYNSWPDAGITPFRSEKNTNWEGGWRVPRSCAGRARSQRAVWRNGIVSHQDMLPTLLAAAGEPDITQKLLAVTPSATRRSTCTSTDTTCCRTSPARPTRARGTRSSTSATTATSSPSEWTTTRSSSSSNGQRD